jgi:metal-sulfur cluster biosynthetic enzyme
MKVVLTHSVAANGAYEGIYSMVLSSQINHIPVVSTEQTIDFVMTLTATECVKTTFIDQTISDMNFIINHNQPDTVQTMLDW